MTGPLPLPSPSGVRIAGDRYQWLVAWQACVTVLHDAATGAANPAVSVGVEVDDAGNVDDVVIRRRRPPHSYKQVKYAVDSSTPVNSDYLIDAEQNRRPVHPPQDRRGLAPAHRCRVTRSSWRSSPTGPPTRPTRSSPAGTPAHACSFPGRRRRPAVGARKGTGSMGEGR